eukprot:SAG25_NODE_3650_length_1012_cov_0.938664_2_plen_73_part_00
MHCPAVLPVAGGMLTIGLDPCSCLRSQLFVEERGRWFTLPNVPMIKKRRDWVPAVLLPSMALEPPAAPTTLT